MHDTAKNYGDLFFKTYVSDETALKIIDIGAQDVNGSLRECVGKKHKYVGVDFVSGKGVDLVLKDPYKLPFDDESFDVCVSSSCFEHSEMFWVLFNDILRILKPTGLLYINAPSNGPFHRYPVDCWRFYPDAGKALESWGKHSGFNVVMIESFLGKRKMDVWNDFVAIFLKDKKFLSKYSKRLINHVEYINGRQSGDDEIKNHSKSVDFGKKKDNTVKDFWRKIKTLGFSEKR